MVEALALFEWSTEVCLALSTKFCSWVVPETDSEYDTNSNNRSMSNHEPKKKNPLFAMKERFDLLQHK